MQKLLIKSMDYGIKLASLAVTGPATWVVSGELFKDISAPAILLIMRLAAVFLVEGVLLSNWLLLEFDQRATELVKARYGITALAMYGAMLVIAWQHEGPVGIVFRFALLAALIGSGWDTYVNTWSRMTASVDRSPENSGKVKRNARNLAIMEAIETRKSTSRITLKSVELHEAAELQRIQNEHSRIMAALQREHRTELQTIRGDDSEKPTTKRGNLTYPVERINADRRSDKNARLELIRSALALQPELSASEVVAALQRQTGVAESTAWNDWRDYHEQPSGNGNGHSSLVDA